MGGMIHGCFTLLSFWATLSDVYKNLSSNEVGRKSGWFGMRAMLYSIIGAIVSSLCVWGTIACLGAIEGDGLWVIILFFPIIALIASALISAVLGPIRGLFCVVYQFRLNRGPWAWIGLVFWLLSIGVFIAVVLYVLSVLG